MKGEIVWKNNFLLLTSTCVIQSALMQLDITTEVNDRLDCEFIRSRNFMIS